MKIPLDDPIWSRLYGPYGVQNVNDTLSKFQADWDIKIANDLYWEHLHHQDDIYPVTYAALPWLWEMMPQEAEAKIDLLCFFSHVIYCSEPSEYAMVPCGKYKGLSLDIPKHAHAWLNRQERLGSEDKVLLKALESWFDKNQNMIAEEALKAAQEVDGATSVHLCRGFLSLLKADNLMSAIDLWHGKHEFKDILEEALPAKSDVAPTKALLSKLKDTDGTLTKFLNDWISKFDDTHLDHPDQLKLF